eukprot:387454-Ditylum_brightwellii.AAC.1
MASCACSSGDMAMFCASDATWTSLSSCGFPRCISCCPAVFPAGLVPLSWAKKCCGGFHCCGGSDVEHVVGHTA